MSDSRHPEVLALLAEDPPPDREGLLLHVQSCALCRARIAIEDPSRLFALLALEPVPEAVLDRVSRGVAAAMDERPVEARSRGYLRVASLAAAASLFAVLATYLLRHEPAPSAPQVASAVAPATESREPEARFELLASPGEARVVDLAVGEVQLVMIFDRRLDL